MRTQGAKKNESWRERDEEREEGVIDGGMTEVH